MSQPTPIAKRGCAVDGCDRPHSCKGYCVRHYDRLRSKGVVSDTPFRRYGQEKCSVPDCPSSHYAGGYCIKHYNRWRAWGSVEDRPRPTCTVEGCGRPGYRRGKYEGLCRRHANRMQSNGTTDDPRPSLRERFFALTERDANGCLMWTGFVDEDGYARISVNGRSRRAYRIALQLAGRPIPKGLEPDHVCHSNDLLCPAGAMCPHRRCVESDHLELVTREENTRRGWVNRRAREAAAAGTAVSCLRVIK